MTELDVAARDLALALRDAFAGKQRLRQATVDAVNLTTPPTVDLTLAGKTFTEVRYLGGAPEVGQEVWVELMGGDLLVHGPLQASPAAGAGGDHPDADHNFLVSVIDDPIYRARCL